MNIYDALHDLGVRDDTLAPEEKAALDRNGYLALKDVLSAAQLATMRERLAQLLVAEGANAGTEVHQEAGTDRLSDLINKDAVFDVCFTNPRVLAAMAYVLGGEFKLSSLNFRAALPGSGLQDLHADWGEAVTPGDYHVCNSIWLLDDFTENNGATRVVPGTHRSGKRPSDDMAKPSAAHPDEIKLIAPVGTVVVFNSHLWHGGTLNTTDAARRACHSYFCRRNEVQQLDQRRYIRAETLALLSPAARYILDV